MLTLPFDNSYARLPARFYARLPPAPVSAPRLIALNEGLCTVMGLDAAALASPDGIAVLAGNTVPETAAPLAMAYAGHQFGNFVPQLGDGRAILLGEIAGHDGVRRDWHIKGGGPTPFSRQGDGRAALGPVLREYLISEAMARLSVPTTRALAVLESGDHVWRDAPLPGGILVRVAQSHVRAGTFQYFAARGDGEAVRILAGYVIARHYPDAGQASDPYAALLEAVIARQADLVARWLCLGFVHGVMNTDNVSIAGETIDYGPCAFLDRYEPLKVFSSIDRGGRYAFEKQPQIAAWNMARLAECLLPLFAGDEAAQLARANAAVAGFAPAFEAAYARGLRAKLGLMTQRDGDLALARDLFTRMAAGGVDFTALFFGLRGAVDGEDGPARALFAEPGFYDDWASLWRARLAAESTQSEARAQTMRLANPYIIPRNHRVEEAINAGLTGDFALFHALNAALGEPFDATEANTAYAAPPAESQIVSKTFCGT